MMINRSGFTGQRVKPLLNLPHSLMRGFEEALLAKVNVIAIIIFFNFIIRLCLRPKLMMLIVDHKDYGQYTKKPRCQKEATFCCPRGASG